MNLITSNVQTMSSYFLWKQLNLFRSEDGQNRVRHDDFLKRVVDECDDLGVCEKFAVPNSGVIVDFYELNQDQMLLVGMRESKSVRKKVLNWIKSLSEKDQFKIPQTLPEALQLAADLALKIEQDKPKIEYHDAVLATDNGITTTEIASELGMSAIKLNRLLESMKVQRKIGGRWVLTASHLDQGLTVEVTHVDDGGKSRHSMKWREKGRKLIHELVA